MRVEILTALISVSSAVISPIIVHYAKKYIDERSFSGKRISQMAGAWGGELTQFYNGELLNQKVDGRFSSRGKSINGTLFSSDEDRPFDLSLDGSFLHDDFVLIQ